MAGVDHHQRPAGVAIDAGQLQPGGGRRHGHGDAVAGRAAAVARDPAGRDARECRIVGRCERERQRPSAIAEPTIGDDRGLREIEDQPSTAVSRALANRRHGPASGGSGPRRGAIDIDRDPLRTIEHETGGGGDALIEGDDDPVALHRDAIDRRRQAGSAGEPADQQGEEERHASVMPRRCRAGPAKRHREEIPGEQSNGDRGINADRLTAA